MKTQGIASRIANGVYLEGGRRRATLYHWLEYHAENEDFRFFPVGAPDQFFPIWYGDSPLVSHSGIDNLDIQIGLKPSIFTAQESAFKEGVQRNRVLEYLSFQDLPLTTQLVFNVLVTIPVGIVLLVFLRQFVGVKTLGTFMPVLIGISFRETALIYGLLLFSMLVGVGLVLRFYLERLQLLLVPRLAVVLIFIVISIFTITLLLADSSQSIGLSISLFPW